MGAKISKSSAKAERKSMKKTRKVQVQPAVVENSGEGFRMPSTVMMERSASEAAMRIIDLEQNGELEFPEDTEESSAEV